MNHRADIDGLRALAVLPVLFFHADWPGFDGGFVGVDIFFVISGYLITGILLREAEEGRFSIAAFYERRARRILPALFAMILAVAVAAALLMAPSDFGDAGASIVSNAFFASNFFFWSSAGYFEAAADTKPLLHTWSLAVEEQFYLFLPLLVWALHRRARHWLKPLLVLLMLASFALAVRAVAVAPEDAFYLPHYRAWELLLGSVLAAGIVPPLRRAAWAEAAAAAGAAFILAAIFLYDSSTPFPGAAALLPCAGAALLIHANAAQPTVVGRLLAWRPLVAIGLVSYSLYLWHWPITVFTRYWLLGELTVLASIGIVAASFAAAFLSWRYIEQPFRRSAGTLPRRRVLRQAAAASLLVAGTGYAAHANSHLPALATEEGREAARFLRVNRLFDEECAIDAEGAHPAASCTFGAAGRLPDVALWGDSHGSALVEELGEEAARRGRSLRFYGQSGCPPLPGLVRLDDGPERRCGETGERILRRLLADRGIGTVVLAARWSYYLEGPADELGPAEKDVDDSLLAAEGELLPADARQRLFAGRLAATVAALRRAGKRVVLVHPVPEAGYHVPNTLFLLERSGEEAEHFTRSYAAFAERNAFVLAAFARLGGAVLHARPHERLCGGTRCILFGGGRTLYLDDDHLSRAGARWIMPELEQAFAAPPQPRT